MLPTAFVVTAIPIIAFFLLTVISVEAKKSFEDVTRDIAIAAIVIGGVAFLMSCISFCVPRPKYGRGSSTAGASAGTGNAV